VPDHLPVDKSFVEKMRDLIKSKKKFVTKPSQLEHLESVLQKLDQMGGASTKEGGENRDYNREMVQQQEQQKSKQREVRDQKQQQIEYGSDEGSGHSWTLECLSFFTKEENGKQSGEKEKGEDISRIEKVGYQLDHFEFIHGGVRIPFPSSLFITLNHTGRMHRSDLPRRLKNVYAVATWSLKQQGSLHTTLIVSLAEAETLRRAISGGQLPNLAIGIQTLEGLWLTQIPSVQRNGDGGEDVLGQMSEQDLQCARFFNNDTTYSDKQVIGILKAMTKIPPKTRRAFFEEVMRGRRRSRVSWEGTNVAKVFSYPNEEVLLSLRAITLKIRNAISREYSSLVEAFKAFDSNHDGWLSQDEVSRAFSSLSIELEPSKLVQLMQHADQNDDGFLNLREFAAHFAVDIDPDSDISIPDRRDERGKRKVEGKKRRTEKKGLIQTLAMVADTKEVSAGGPVGSQGSDVATKMRVKTLKSLGRPLLLNQCRVDFGYDSIVRTTGKDSPLITFQGISVTRGKHYYEIEIVQSGVGFVGWGDERFAGNQVGDDDHSFAMAGHLGQLWVSGKELSSGEKSSLPKWEAGDVLYCMIDAADCIISFTLNGEWEKAVSLSPSSCPTLSSARSFSPLISFDESLVFKLNSGQYRPKYPVPSGTGYRSLSRWVRHKMAEMYAAEAAPRFGNLVPHSAKQEVTIEKWTVRPDAQFAERVKEGASEEMRSIFPSVRLGGVLLTSGKWYYEVGVLNPGVGQLGWVDVEFWAASREGVGVGDDKHSWAYDGNRRCKWHAQKEIKWGGKQSWKYGDVIGCACDLINRTISFSLNGKMDGGMGVAFSNVPFAGGVTPGITLQGGLEANFACTINFGDTPFRFGPPPGYRGVWEGIEEIKRKRKDGDNKDDSSSSSAPLTVSQSGGEERKRVGLLATSGCQYVNIDERNEVVVSEHYPSMVGDRCSVFSGKWYFEVSLSPSFPVQADGMNSVCLGFAKKGFVGDAVLRGSGVGDDEFSWGIDNAGVFRHGGVVDGSSSLSFGERGATIGCGVDFEEGVFVFVVEEMKQKEEEAEGEAEGREKKRVTFKIEGLRKKEGLVPALSVRGDGSSFIGSYLSSSFVSVNFGESPFVCCPDGFSSFQSLL